MPSQRDQEWMPEREACIALNVVQQRLRRMVQGGAFRVIYAYHDPNERVALVLRADVEQYLAEHGPYHGKGSWRKLAETGGE